MTKRNHDKFFEKGHIVSEGKTQKSNRSLKFFCLLWVGWVFALFLVQGSALNTSIKTYISRPADFILREKLEQTPPLHKKLKTIALDDQSVAYLNDNELPFKDLVLLLENIARKKPKVIIMDRLFAESPKGENLGPWFDRLRNIDVPIHTGSYFNLREISFRKAIDIESKGFDYRSYKGSDLLNPDEIMFKKQEGIAYGFAQDYEGGFSKVGHFSLNEDGTFYPMVLYKNQYLIPYLGMYSGDDFQLNEQGGLRISGHDVPMNRDGMSMINYRPVMTYYRSARSLRSMISRARNGEPERNIDEGDVVLMTFNFYTGSTTFVKTPFGGVPGSFLVASVIDSVMQGEWITQFDYEEVLIVVLSILGIYLGLVSGPIQFWGLSLGLSLTYFCLSTYLFSYHDYMVPWFLPILTFMVSGLIFYVYRRLGSELLKVQIEKDYYSEKSLRLEQENKKIKLEERLNLGKAVQEILLPDEMNMNFSAHFVGMKYESAQEMSGDWLYVWKVSDQEKRIILGDVVGKGPSAAIPVAVIIGILGECEKQKMTVEEAMSRINERLVVLFDKQITTTCAAISIFSDQRVVFYNAGSPGWFLLKSSGTKYIPLRSSSLGLSEDHEVVSSELVVSEEVQAFTFTDGYLEGSRAFKRLLKYLEAQNEVDVDVVHEALLTVGEGFRLEDDRSLLAVKLSAAS